MNSERARPSPGGYGLAALCVAAAVAIAWGAPGVARTVPYVPFFVAAAVVAARAGLMPGLLAAAAGAMGAQLVIASNGGPRSLATLLEFVMTSGVAVWALSARHTSEARMRAQSALVTEIEALRRENQELASAKQSASHKLVQPLGAITNYAEVIRAHSTGSIRDSAARIIDVATRAAGNIREQLDGNAVEAPQHPGSAAAPAGEGSKGESSSLAEAR